ncbi:MAG: C45 family autoproteolytic acyltransferase/hydrolase [Planctomycetota bacterium]|nr:C45 family autoproteolytic acyltransferase/hydrolase [Planctomycetota bacterium]MDA1251295.1 C45 family autoproteolytic acyltransferase/hydrolase [Planctomycetota bacterium]
MIAARSAMLLLIVISTVGSTQAETIARCGKGWLETINGYPVLHLKGSPREMGFQHGALLKEHVRENMHNLLDVKGDATLVELGPIKVTPKAAIEAIIEIQKPFIPKRYFEEMEGLAAGADVSIRDARITNFIPELFHCSGFALMNSATKNGKLLHGRVLDYAVDWGLQDHAVIIVAEPEGRIPFVNVSYAGFVGSVTGMNAEHVSIGEMGGRGLGHWQGVPMSLLVREVLETGSDLEKAIAVFRDSPRTCEYFYVIADAKTNEAVGMEASWDEFTLVRPGTAHPLLPTPVKDCVLLSAGDRYEELVRRTKDGRGGFTAKEALKLMERPVAMKSNLHNVLFEPETTRFWVANASKDKQPAAEQPYHPFQLTELLKRSPDTSSREIPMPELISAAAAR